MGMDIIFISLSEKESAKGILRAEMAKRGLSAIDLADLLVARGMKITRAAIDNRISRGTFSANFMIESLRAIGCSSIAIVDTEKMEKQ